MFNYFANKVELDSCSITKCSNPSVYDHLLILSALFLFSLEPSRPTVHSRRSLFQPVEKKRALDDSERRSFYENLMDTFPDSCFVLMAQAECTPEPLQPISTPRESNILSSDKIDAIEKITVA